MYCLGHSRLPDERFSEKEGTKLCVQIAQGFHPRKSLLVQERELRLQVNLPAVSVSGETVAASGTPTRSQFQRFSADWSRPFLTISLQAEDERAWPANAWYKKAVALRWKMEKARKKESRQLGKNRPVCPNSGTSATFWDPEVPARFCVYLYMAG